MTDATILIPTHRHAALLPYALRSAVDQQGASVEVIVVGDGVEDATRAVIADFEGDSRVRFFDFPKARGMASFADSRSEGERLRTECQPITTCGSSGSTCPGSVGSWASA